MNPADIQTEKAGDKPSSDKQFYDNQRISNLESHGIWMREIDQYHQIYCQKLRQSLSCTYGVIAELGAGSCGLSACLSRLPEVHKIFAVDISRLRMEEMIGLSVSILAGNLEKIHPLESDFNTTLPFEDESLDAVVFDASLHHTRSMWSTLTECNRVLKTGGILVAQRESYLSPFRAKKQIAALLSSPEIAARVSENTFFLEQYLYYLTVHGFESEFLKISRDTARRAFAFLNGCLFTDGVIYSVKKENLKR